MGLISIKKQIERDVEIAEEFQDGNKSNRGAESQDSYNNRYLQIYL